MPTYTYQCKECDHSFEVFHAMSAVPKVKCAECGKACKRLIGKGSGVIFKGSGFYQTDYKKSGAHADKGGDSKSAAKSEGGSEGKSESKSESKPVTTSETKSDSGSSKPKAKSE